MRGWYRAASIWAARIWSCTSPFRTSCFPGTHLRISLPQGLPELLSAADDQSLERKGPMQLGACRSCWSSLKA